MNWLKFLTNPSAVGELYRRPFARRFIAVCALLPGNVWTIMRAPGALVVIWLFDYSVIGTAIAFAFFALTDAIDGQVARFRGEANGHGAWLDPLVDKMFILPLLYYFGCWYLPILNEILFWIMLGIETILRLPVSLIWKWRYKTVPNNLFKANWFGKAKFTGQSILGLCLFLAVSFPAAWWSMVLNGLLIVVILLAASSVMGYMLKSPKTN